MLTESVHSLVHAFPKNKLNQMRYTNCSKDTHTHVCFACNAQERVRQGIIPSNETSGSGQVTCRRYRLRIDVQPNKNIFVVFVAKQCLSSKTKGTTQIYEDEAFH